MTTHTPQRPPSPAAESRPEGNRAVHADDALLEALADARAELTELADATLTEERLDRQRAAILQRLADPRPGSSAGSRVLAFPERAGVSRSTRPAARWLAAAAAAGLLIGLGAGELSVRLFEQPSSASARTERRSPRAPAAVVVAPDMHDEEFLQEMEVTLNVRGVAELRALDALTPRVTTVSTRGGR